MLSKKENLADKIIVEYPDMGAMLARGMLFTQNPDLRKTFCEKIRELMVKQA